VAHYFSAPSVASVASVAIHSCGSRYARTRSALAPVSPNDSCDAHWLVVQSCGTAATTSSMTSAPAGNPATANAVRAGKAVMPRPGRAVIPSGSQVA
jgi:hypothetical protein